jgi:hypothetical protein
VNNPTGAWKCPICGFVLMKRVISAADGAVSLNRDGMGEDCPNGCGVALKPIPPDDMHPLERCGCCGGELPHQPGHDCT